MMLFPNKDLRRVTLIASNLTFLIASFRAILLQYRFKFPSRTSTTPFYRHRSKIVTWCSKKGTRLICGWFSINALNACCNNKHISSSSLVSVSLVWKQFSRGRYKQEENTRCRNNSFEHHVTNNFDLLFRVHKNFGFLCHFDIFSSVILFYNIFWFAWCFLTGFSFQCRQKHEITIEMWRLLIFPMPGLVKWRQIITELLILICWIFHKVDWSSRDVLNLQLPRKQTQVFQIYSRKHLQLLFISTLCNINHTKTCFLSFLQIFIVNAIRKQPPAEEVNCINKILSRKVFNIFFTELMWRIFGVNELLATSKEST